MEAYNFSRSFITFRLDLREKPPVTLSHAPPTTLNNARIQIECCCRMTHQEGGVMTCYVLGASCKTERVGVDRDVWTLPNADFCLVASSEEYLILKSWHQNNPGVLRYPPSLGVQPERQVGAISDVWTAFAIDLCPVEGRALETIEAVVDATLRKSPMVARTEYTDGPYRVRLDYPVKTINVNERDLIFQTDTGPLILPDLSPERVCESDRLVERFDLAYAAFNCTEWAEFILNLPTKVSEEVSVNHYSRIRRIENTENSLIAIGATEP